jgi:chromosome segregation ATPase
MSGPAIDTIATLTRERDELKFAIDDFQEELSSMTGSAANYKRRLSEAETRCRELEAEVTRLKRTSGEG